MSEKPYNPNDPAFLLSRSLDERLSETDRKQLDEAVASSESQRAESDGLAAVDGLVRRFGQEPVELDWAQHEALILAELRGEAEGLGAVDALLTRWKRCEVNLDETEFADSVVAAIRDRNTGVGGQDAPARRRRWIFRLAVPLAAAAAIALTVSTALWRAPPDERVSIVSIRPGHRAGPAGSGVANAPRAVVTFARAPADHDVAREAKPRVSLISVGASPIQAQPEERYPI